jgi:hypothetical protein
MSLQYGNVISINDPRLNGVKQDLLFKHRAHSISNVATNFDGKYGPRGARYKLLGNSVKISPPISERRNWEHRGLPVMRKSRKTRKNRKTRRATRRRRN